MTNARLTGFWCCSLLAVSTLSLSGHLFAREKSPLAVMPEPAHVAQGEGEFFIDGNFGITIKGYDELRLARAQQRFLDILSKETGIPFKREAVATQSHFIIQTAGPSAAVQQLGEDESYHLTISTTDVELKAPNPLGVLRGLQTFLQLVRINEQGFSVPVVTIDDAPRFPWRGLLIDSGHRFVPIPAVKRNLDAMEAVKLNVFHWRFADDQGFHIESKKFPLLQEKASSGLYYSQDEVREIVAYARDRGIRVVPEFDMPCHAKSWFQGYPDLSGGKDPSQSSAMDPSRESTYKLLNGFIGEMSALFPDSYFHTGGDECDMKEWESNPRIREYMQAHSIKDGAALQVRFTARIQKIVAAHKKIMEGWDEVLQPDTPKDVVIQSWRGPRSLAEAARSGNRGVLSSGYYIDLNQSAEEHYLVDPLGDNTAALTPEQKNRVLGGEATMWTDIVDADNMDNRIWPRTAAIAERLWSPEQIKDVDSMYQRLAIVSQKLEYYGPRHRLITEEMLQRMSGDPNPEALKVLAAVVQPPRMYERQQLRGDFTVLNRLDDAVSPESDTAREFDVIAQRISSGTATAQDWQQARAWLELWRDNDAKLQPMLKRSFLTQDLAPVSSNLRRIAEIGLQALDDLHEHHSVNAGLRQRNIEFLKSVAKPQAVLLLMPATSVERLVQASKTQ
ncbi:family 20 glycosylhydrolase [Edaphobacter aggregans]|uniref:family 20 glycosylhydrolase n=1 Tax=Edaphobacter aggregans TaxID=570835 RepID=UPI0005542787|nr:family 20 glycosylhydrolase [Edaphobacter aggregans]